MSTNIYSHANRSIFNGKNRFKKNQLVAEFSLLIKIVRMNCDDYVRIDKCRKMEHSYGFRYLRQLADKNCLMVKESKRKVNVH